MIRYVNRLVRLACMLMLAVLFVDANLSAASAAATKPNIVFIIADDMGWTDVGCYGNRYVDTPNIDKLATEGVRYTDFYAGTPVCSSTRSSIFSGQYAARVGITDFIPGHWRPFEKLIVPPIENALPLPIKTPGDVLKEAGYKTGYFGKWHLGHTRELLPDRRGFEMTENTVGPGFKKWRTRKDNGPKRVDLLTDYAMYFLEQHKDQPFFLTVSHYAVHIPVEASEQLVSKYEKKIKPDGKRLYNSRYAAMTEHLDGSVGAIVQKIKSLGLEKNTLVIFTSDNGGLRKIYTGVGEEVSDNVPLRDEKGTVYEGGIRVPLIAKWPGVIKPGGVCDEIAISNDFMPTFIDVSGASKVKSQVSDGLSLLPTFKDAASSLGRDAIFFHYPHYHHGRPAGAIRRGDWKLIENFEDGSVELYNLKDDIGETRDLLVAKAGLQQVKKALRNQAVGLQKELAAWRKAVGARMPTKNETFDASKASQWWSRRTKKLLDIEAMRKRYESKKLAPSSKGGK